MGPTKSDFDRLFRSFEERLVAIFAAKTRDPDLAEEIVQIAAKRAFGSFDSSKMDNFQAWIYRIAHNEFLDHCRRVNRRRQAPLDESMTARPQPPSQFDLNPLSPIFGYFDSVQHAVVCLHRQMTALFNDRYHLLVVLRFGLDDIDFTPRTLDEVAAISGLEPRQVSQALYAICHITAEKLTETAEARPNRKKSAVPLEQLLQRLMKALTEQRSKS